MMPDLQREALSCARRTPDACRPTSGSGNSWPTSGSSARPTSAGGWGTSTMMNSSRSSTATGRSWRHDHRGCLNQTLQLTGAATSVSGSPILVEPATAAEPGR